MPEFTPPTTRESSDDRFWGRFGIPTGVSVLWDGARFVASPTPWLGEIADLVEGVTWFRGGCDYTISMAVADQLIASGFHVPYTHNVSVSGIAPTSGVGSPGVAFLSRILPSGIASTSAIGTASVKGRNSISVTGIGSGLTFGTPDVQDNVNRVGVQSWSGLAGASAPYCGLMFVDTNGLTAKKNGTLLHVTIGGTLHAVDVYVMTGVLSGSNFIVRDGEAVEMNGTATNQTFGVNLTVQTGDRIAVLCQGDVTDGIQGGIAINAADDATLAYSVSASSAMTSRPSNGATVPLAMNSKSYVLARGIST